jgi:hypothetical protein
MRSSILAALVFIALQVATASGVAAADAALAQFFGEYAGRAVQAPNEALAPRDLGIKIGPHDKDGFSLDWTTVIHGADGPKRQTYSINFAPLERAGFFASAMRNDTFGHAEPLDPLKGDPYIWARIAGRTLTVHAMLITDDGGYEMQVYERTLTEGGSGMSIKFTRNRDGRQLKTVTGLLKRMAP